MRLRWIVLLGLTALPACHRGEAVEPAATEPGLTAAQLSFLKFAPVAEVAAGHLADLNGTIEFDEEHTARLAALVPGRVAQLLVQVGDRVDADQPLVALESPEVKTVEAEYVRAEADRTLARKTADRATRLRAAQAIAEKDYQQAEEEAAKAAADFERARAALERLRVAPGEVTSRYLLRAPFAGTVVERKALVGMEVSTESAEPLVVVSDLSRVRVVMRVPERQLPLLRAGERVAVRVDAYPQEFPGTVVAVGDVIEDATRTVPVRCTVPNPDRLLKPAMFARVALEAPPGMQLIVVPATALLSDGQHFRVLVRTGDGHLESRPVEVGAEVDGRTQIVSGVHVGEEVVSEGAIFAAQQLTNS
jgi:cobalt-zinc-cadmium efflux system membrane fusion protein